MGLAMGCVGMCLNDFCRLTPSEFTAVFEAWQQQETYAERRGGNRHASLHAAY